MAIVHSVTCDECGATKQPSNGWLMAHGGGIGKVVFRAWDERDSVNENVHHLCGESCAMKFLSRHIGALVGKEAK